VAPARRRPYRRAADRKWYSSLLAAAPFPIKFVYSGRVRAMACNEWDGNSTSRHTEEGVASAPGRVVFP
jgi:hypothetical protein